MGDESIPPTTGIDHEALRRLTALLEEIVKGHRAALEAVYWETSVTAVELMRQRPDPDDAWRTHERLLNTLNLATRNPNLMRRAKTCQKLLQDIEVIPRPDEARDAWFERLYAALREREAARLVYETSLHYADEHHQIGTMDRNRLAVYVEKNHGFSPAEAEAILESRGFAFDDGHSKIWVPCEVFPDKPMFLDQVSEAVLKYESAAYQGLSKGRFSDWLKRSGVTGEELDQVRAIEARVARREPVSLLVHELAWTLFRNEIAVGTSPARLFTNPLEVAEAVERGAVSWSAIEKLTLSGVVGAWSERLGQLSINRAAQEFRQVGSAANLRRLKWAFGLPLELPGLGAQKFHTPAELAEAVLQQPAAHKAAWAAARDGTLTDWLRELPGTVGDARWGEELSRARGKFDEGDQFAFWWGIYRHASRRALAVTTPDGISASFTSVDALCDVTTLAALWDTLKADFFGTGRLHAWIVAYGAPRVAEIAQRAPRPPPDHDADLNRLLWRLSLCSAGVVEGMVLEWGAHDRPILTHRDLLDACASDVTRAEVQAFRRYPLEWLSLASGSPQECRDFATRMLEGTFARRDLASGQRGAIVMLGAALGVEGATAERARTLARRIQNGEAIPGPQEVLRALRGEPEVVPTPPPTRGGSTTAPSARPPRPEPPRSPSRVGPAVVLGGVVLALGVAALGWWGRPVFPDRMVVQDAAMDVSSRAREDAGRVVRVLAVQDAGPVLPPPSSRCAFTMAANNLGGAAVTENTLAVLPSGDEFHVAWVVAPRYRNGAEDTAHVRLNADGVRIGEPDPAQQDATRDNPVSPLRVGRVSLVTSPGGEVRVQADVTERTPEQQRLRCLGQGAERALSIFDSPSPNGLASAPPLQLPWMYFCRTLGTDAPFVVGLYARPGEGTERIAVHADLVAHRGGGVVVNLGPLELPSDVRAESDPISWLQENGPAERPNRVIPLGMTSVALAGRGHAVAFKYQDDLWFLWLDEQLRPQSAPARVAFSGAGRRVKIRKPNLALSQGGRVLLSVSALKANEPYRVWATTASFGEPLGALAPLDLPVVARSHALDPSVVPLSRGGWLLAVTQGPEHARHGGQHVALQVLDATLHPEGGPRVVETGPQNTAYPVLGMLPSGRFLLVYLGGTSDPRTVHGIPGGCDAAP